MTHAIKQAIFSVDMQVGKLPWHRLDYSIGFSPPSFENLRSLEQNPLNKAITRLHVQLVNSKQAVLAMIGVALSESGHGQLDEVHTCTGILGLYKALFG